MKKEVVKDQELDLSVLTKDQSSDEVVNSLKQQHLEMKKQVKNKKYRRVRLSRSWYGDLILFIFIKWFKSITNCKH